MLSTPGEIKNDVLTILLIKFTQTFKKVKFYIFRKSMLIQINKTIEYRVHLLSTLI